MTTKLTRSGYEAIVKGDLSWLLRQPRSLERDHIAEVVKASVDHEYPAPKPAAATLGVSRYMLETDLRSAIHERHEAGISEALAKWDECAALRADLAKAKERIAELEGPRCDHIAKRGFCGVCSQWACLGCGAIVPPGFGPRCDDCKSGGAAR